MFIKNPILGFLPNKILKCLIYFAIAKMYIWEENVIGLSNISVCVSAAFRLPTSDGSASKGKQQTSEPVHILKRSFARTVSVVSHF